MKLTISSWLHLLCKETLTRSSLALFRSFFKAEEIPLDVSLERLPPKALELFLTGSPRSVKREGVRLHWKGLNTLLALLSKSTNRETKDALLPLLETSVCLACQGARLNPLARNVRIGEKSIADLCELPVTETSLFLDAMELSGEHPPFLEETLQQLKMKLHFLKEIGLGYLSLGRSAPTLSGGEAQRIRLARQLGSGLTGCLYVLDEPTIGLHPHDNEKLNRALKTLCALGNTLLLVEHDPLTLQLADYILDFGPHAGKQGGTITASGTIEEIKQNPHSLTGAYLSGRLSVPVPEERKKAKKWISIENGALHNLKDVDIQLGLGIVTCLTGVSGSGKSTLLSDLLRPALENFLRRRKKTEEPENYLGARFSGFDQIDKLLVLDQNPIGQTNRADVSTYVDLLSPLRTFFASLPEAKLRGLQPKNFSFNHRKGMCTRCQGLGTQTIAMQFLPPVKVTCDACHGFRFNPMSLKVMVKGKHLGHVLQMTVSEALQFLPPIPKAVRILETLQSVGLDYLQLGQEIATLSGGEAQRIRLSRELSKRSTGRTLYLLDEPTVGLHADDIVKLLPIFQRLTEKGNTVVLIEHNLDVIQCADQIIDMGPGSGASGGRIVATGTPEQIAANPQSLTGKYIT